MQRIVSNIFPHVSLETEYNAVRVSNYTILRGWSSLSVRTKGTQSGQKNLKNTTENGKKSRKMEPEEYQTLVTLSKRCPAVGGGGEGEGGFKVYNHGVMAR